MLLRCFLILLVYEVSVFSTIEFWNECKFFILISSNYNFDLTLLLPYFLEVRLFLLKLLSSDFLVWKDVFALNRLLVTDIYVSRHTISSSISVYFIVSSVPKTDLKSYISLLIMLFFLIDLHCWLIYHNMGISSRDARLINSPMRTS